MKRRQTWRVTSPTRLLYRSTAAIALFCAVDLLTGAATMQVGRLRTERATVRAEMTQDPYRVSDWAQEYWTELAQYQERWDPYIVYRVGDIHGRFINVENGVRRTYVPVGVTEGRPRIWMFGGSAAWGHGVRDLYTLPSWLARVAEEHGELYEVRNYAESGWVNWQGIVYLLEKLADGGRPDLVIFYSGVNETLSARQWPGLRRPIWDGDMYPTALSEFVMQRQRPLARLWGYYRDTSLLGAALAELLGKPPLVIDEKLTQRVIADVKADRAIVEALGREYGFATLFVWQLTVADKPSLTAQERVYAGWLPASERGRPALDWWVLASDLRDAYDTIGTALVRENRVAGVPNALAAVPATTFIDWMHPNELGNAYIARAIHGLVDAMFRSRERRDQTTTQ